MAIIMKNVSSSDIVISLPTLNFRRPMAPGQAVPMTKEVLDELSFDPGFNNLISAGYIKIEGEEVESIAQPVGEIAEADTIKELFNKKNLSKFTALIKNAAPATLDTIKECAVSMGITDPAYTKLIKKYCNVDVIEAIAAAHAVESQND